MEIELDASISVQKTYLIIKADTSQVKRYAKNVRFVLIQLSKVPKISNLFFYLMAYQPFMVYLM